VPYHIENSPIISLFQCIAKSRFVILSAFSSQNQIIPRTRKRMATVSLIGWLYLFEPIRSVKIGEYSDRLEYRLNPLKLTHRK